MPALCQISRLFQFFPKAVWDAWRTKVAGDLSSRAGFRGGRYLDFQGRAFARDFVWGCLEWISSRLCQRRNQRRNRSLSFFGGPDSDGHLFWECPHPSFVHIRESPEFHDLLLLDRSS